ncbi:unnamed protein product [Protopolystoma xenopodis]|uniref:SKICH domain-containing protein n=1 Tax=Protopolystoma xenopodis TaxID=117903 RepID=A0A448WY45_9PLAT|nr:unnamed protein product [Protopolystoma xenopodis]
MKGESAISSADTHDLASISHNPLPPPTLSTHTWDWIAVYPIDFEDLSTGYTTYVYAPTSPEPENSMSQLVSSLATGAMTASLASCHLENDLPIHVVGTVPCIGESDVASDDVISFLSDSPAVVVNAGLPLGPTFRGRIEASHLEELAGKTIQLAYMSRLKNCPQGYSKPVKVSPIYHS